MYCYALVSITANGVYNNNKGQPDACTSNLDKITTIIEFYTSNSTGSADHKIPGFQLKKNST